MSRLQSGQAQFNKEWHVLEEVIGCALAQLDSQLRDHPVTIHLPPDLPLVKIDDLLMERVVINLLENAIIYAPGNCYRNLRGDSRSSNSGNHS